MRLPCCAPAVGKAQRWQGVAEGARHRLGAGARGREEEPRRRGRGPPPRRSGPRLAPAHLVGERKARRLSRSTGLREALR